MIDSKKVLWKSVSALMTKHYGGENLTRLAKDCGFGPGTASRMKECKTSVGLEIIDKVAKHFNVDTWQLMVPGFDPENPPTLQPISKAEKELYAKFKEFARAALGTKEKANS